MVELAAAVTRPLVQAHGAPVHVGDPAAIGIADIMVTVSSCVWLCAEGRYEK